jgi:hypothetical protein
MTSKLTQVERAFILAASGKVSSVGELRNVLRTEGYPKDGQIGGLTITR